MSISTFKSTTWKNDTGRELVRLNDDGTAIVVPSTCDAATLYDLAEACTAAADALNLIADAKHNPTGAQPCKS